MILLDGKIVRKHILDKVKKEVSHINDKLSFVVISVGADPASLVYVKQKEKMALEMGFGFKHVILDSSVKESVLLEEIDKYNYDDTYQGIIVQMPLPAKMDQIKVANKVLPSKDIDGLSFYNTGSLCNNRPLLVPCTPLGVIEILKYYKIDVTSLNVVIVGRSNLVGKPLSYILTNMDATVSLCHSKTKNLKDYTLRADILIVCVGKKDFITGDMVKEGACVIDVGINRFEGKLYGDCEFSSVSLKSSYITPVPFGVGQTTVACIASNLLLAYKNIKGLK